MEDSSASISADGLTLYFTSNRADGYGGYDILMTKRVAWFVAAPPKE
jgi:hypothetical protein